MCLSSHLAVLKQSKLLSENHYKKKKKSDPKYKQFFEMQQEPYKSQVNSVALKEDKKPPFIMILCHVMYYTKVIHI